MRTLFGIIIGAALTVGGAYVYDQHNTADALNGPAVVQRNLVNWDVVSVKWQHLTERARAEWAQHAG